MKPYPLCLGNISKDFARNSMKKTELRGYVNAFSFDYNIIDTRYILDIHKYMFGFIKNMFILLLSFSGSSATKCMSLNKEQCQTRPFVIDLNRVEHKYYPFMII